jgi:hypothetical protein
MDATQVVIHFIGIVLFTTSVLNDPGVHAILPAIQQEFASATINDLPKEVTSAGTSSATPGATISDLPKQVASAKTSTSVTTHAHVSTEIEPHVALLIFREDIVANDSQWPASSFPKAAQLSPYKYVQLTGEHVTFIVDSPKNGTAGVPPDLPRLADAASAALSSGYQWPYAKAAAVVDIPEGGLSACDPGGGRIDTTLLLNTTGTLTVVAAKSGVVKTLVLKTNSNPTIYLANVPMPRGNGPHTGATGERHYLAYYRMLGKDLTNTSLVAPSNSVSVPHCEENVALSANVPTTTSPRSVFARLRLRLRAFFQPSDPGTPTEHFPEDKIIALTNAECSNTQWP